eukprot:Nk52_evm14s233 gene=Nk52_evmTU14s233
MGYRVSVLTIFLLSLVLMVLRAHCGVEGAVVETTKADEEPATKPLTERVTQKGKELKELVPDAYSNQYATKFHLTSYGRELRNEEASEGQNYRQWTLVEGKEGDDMEEKLSQECDNFCNNLNLFGPTKHFLARRNVNSIHRMRKLNTNHLLLDRECAYQWGVMGTADTPGYLTKQELEIEEGLTEGRSVFQWLCCDCGRSGCSHNGLCSGSSFREEDTGEELCKYFMPKPANPDPQPVENTYLKYVRCYFDTPTDYSFDRAKAMKLGLAVGGNILLSGLAALHEYEMVVYDVNANPEKYGWLPDYANKDKDKEED